MELAIHLSIPFIDLDQEIEKDTKQSIRSLFSEKGEAHFRQLEYLHLSKIVGELPRFVMATGGGTPCFFDNLDKMKKAGKTIFINTPIDLIKKRLQQDTVRPLMQSNTLEQLYEKRREWYEKADAVVQSQTELIALFPKN